MMCQLADSYIDASAREVGSAVKVMAVRKTAKYQGLDRLYIFQPIVVQCTDGCNVT